MGRCGALFVALTCLCANVRADDLAAATRFRKEVSPILSSYCSDCHMDGSDKGHVTFDEFASDSALVHSNDLWWKVLKNTRAGIMPPVKNPRPTPAEQQILERWIKYQAFRSESQSPDPGRVTLRRLNRIEYRNTIRDLMGVDFHADEEFPADDSGYGFDNIGDVLTVSPLLLEKYLQAAETIVSSGVPLSGHSLPQTIIDGSDFRSSGGAAVGNRLSFYRNASLARTFQAPHAGDYRLLVDLNVSGSFDFDPGRCRLVFKVDDRQLSSEEYSWQSNKDFHFEFAQKWEVSPHRLAFELTPLVPIEKKINKISLKIVGVTVQGPMDPKLWQPVEAYSRFFPRAEPPGAASERREYAAEILRNFATKAYRRPVDDRTVDRLVDLAEGTYTMPGKRFEEGVARAMVAVLASPRFLFRMEDSLPPQAGEQYPLIDEYALASRLSYFFWSTMPDDELMGLAAKGELRRNLKSQVKRLMEDPRSQALVENFVGQWLEARDVESTSIDQRTVLAADGIFVPRGTAGQKFSQNLLAVRKAMRLETEMCFARIVHENRSVLELLDCDYTYLNEKLAKHYGIPGVVGNEMRLVTLPPDSPRGGLLTEGTMLLVTSNPTRTSPVKRGLFILENVLGTPPAPPPPDIPLLEESARQFTGHEPTMREVMELHRSKPLCASCHSRMDPLGFGLENFNALGMWRDTEHGVKIDVSGKLISGETFNSITELKHILKDNHRSEFYRCLSEKLLTYALGRGLEYYDVETVDGLVDSLANDQGRFSALLTGIVESVPFQRRRVATATAAATVEGAHSSSHERSGP